MRFLPIALCLAAPLHRGNLGFLALAILTTLPLAVPAPAQQKDLYDIDTIQSVSLVFKQANWKSQLVANYKSKTYIRCDVTINGKLFRDAGVRYRGSSSYSKIPAGSEKQPYKVKLDAFVADQDYQGYATLNLNNNFMDPTWIRETVGYYVFRQFMPAPKSNYARLTINNLDYGPFVNTQQMNKAFMREWFPSDDGNRYKPLENFAQQANLAYLGATSAPYTASYEIKNANPPSPWADLIAFTNALNNSGANLESVLPRFVDVDNALRMNAVDVTLLRLDAYVGGVSHNYFMYHDEVHDRFQFMPWDMNNSFGGFHDGAKTLAALTGLSLYYRSTSTSKVVRPLQSKLLQVPAWRSRYVAHCREASRWLDWANLKPVIDRFQRVVASAAASDPKRLYPHSHFSSKSYLASLPEFQDPYNTISDLRCTPANPSSSSPLQFTVRVVPPASRGIDKVKLHWRVKGVYIARQMFDDGQHGDGKANDGVFGIGLPPQAGGHLLEYYVESTVNNGKAWNMSFHPATATFRPEAVYIDHPRGGPALRLNEFLAINVATNKDGAGEFDDWVEIYNSTNGTINVSGMHLSDDPRQPTRWKMPPNQFIPAQGTLLVWCDDDANQGPLHATFKLSGNGEWLGLFDTNGTTLIDDVRFDRQHPDVSTGRLLDQKTSPMVTYARPTPSARNFSGAGGTRLYSALDPSRHVLSLDLVGTPKVGTAVSIDTKSAPPTSQVLVVFSPIGNYIPFIDHTVVLVGSIPLQVIVMANASGTASIRGTIPNIPGLPGVPIYLQSFGIAGSCLVASNAMEMIPYK